MRKQFGTFWRTLKQSLWNVSYYHDVLHARISFSLKYFFALLLFIYFFQFALSALTASFFLPQLPDFVKKAELRLNEFYPKNLVIEVKNGAVTTNAREPLFLDIPELKDEKFKHLITIDTKAEQRDYLKYRTVLLITRNAFVHPDSQTMDLSTYTITPLDNEDTTNIDRAIYDGYKSGVLTYLKMLPSLAPYLLIGLVILGPLIAATIMFVWNIVYLSILAVFFLMLARLFKLTWSYQKVVQVLLHASTLPFILTTVTSLLGVYIPLLHTATLLFWMVLIMARLPETK